LLKFIETKLFEKVHRDCQEAFVTAVDRRDHGSVRWVQCSRERVLQDDLNYGREIKKGAQAFLERKPARATGAR
jgi:hypothetical protein